MGKLKTWTVICKGMIMYKPGIKGWAIILAHAFVGWAFCAAIMGIGMSVMSMKATLITHAIGGPLGFAIISLFYFKKFAHTRPLATALIFVGFVVFMDVFVVALLIERSLEMFASILGTWLPFALIFIVTYVSGLFVKKPATKPEFL